MLNTEDTHLYSSIFKKVNPESLMPLTKLSRIKKLKAGEIYIPEGSMSQKLAYITTGLLRTYCRKENGDEVTLMLRWESQFVASVDSVIYERPSRFIYQALEDTTLIEIDYAKVKEVIFDTPELSASSHSFLLHMLGQAIDRLEEFVLLSPEQRYLKLVSQKPDINNRVPDKYLATMLGITPVSLSRIHKRIALQHDR